MRIFPILLFLSSAAASAGDLNPCPILNGRYQSHDEKTVLTIRTRAQEGAPGYSLGRMREPVPASGSWVEVIGTTGGQPARVRIRCLGGGLEIRTESSDGRELQELRLQATERDGKLLLSVSGVAAIELARSDDN